MEVLLVASLAWFLAQSFKVLSNLVLQKKFEPRLFFASGGMPSAHSAFIVSVATQIGIRNGFNSDIFVLAVAISSIIIYDAVNVRRSVGIQGETINKMIEYTKNDDDPIEIQTLKVVLGHTPLQVFFGILLGISLVYILYFIGII